MREAATAHLHWPALRRPLLWLAVCLVAELGALWPPSFHLTDHVIFWNVGRLYASGASPYDSAPWIALLADYMNVNVQQIVVDLRGAVWPYPPWTGYLFVPFGLIPKEAGIYALHASYLVVGIGAGIATIGALPWRTVTGRTLAVLLVPTFQPFVYAERLGHFDSYLLAGVVLSTAGFVRGRTALLAAGALLLLAKPQVVPLYGLAVLALLVRDRRWRDIGVTAATLVIVAIVTAFLHPEALSVMVAGSVSRLQLLSPESLNPIPDAWTLAQVIGGSSWPAVAVVLVGASVVACVAAIRWSPGDLRDATIFAAAVILSLFLVPYVFSYDQLLLVPAIALIVLAADRLNGARRLPRLMLIVSVVTIAPWILFFAGVASGDHVLSALVPFAFALLLALAMRSIRTAASGVPGSEGATATGPPTR